MDQSNFIPPKQLDKADVHSTEEEVREFVLVGNLLPELTLNHLLRPWGWLSFLN